MVIANNYQKQMKTKHFLILMAFLGCIFGVALTFWTTSRCIVIENPIHLKREEFEPEVIEIEEEEEWIEAEFSAYNNVEEQCDSTPDITASGLKIKGDEKIVAVNGYEFGTKIEIEGFGVYEVQDRMNRRYGINNIDILFHKDIEGALAFGRQKLKYKVL